MTDKDKLLELVHTPAEAAAEHVTFSESMKNAPGVTWGIPAMDDHLLAMHPGAMICLVARPGHCKTSALAYLAKTEAERIRDKGEQDKKCVIYVSWEQITEEIDSYFHVNPDYNATDIMRGAVDLDLVRKNALRRVELPVWLIGDSIARTTPRSLRMTPDIIWETVTAIIENWGVKPSLICGDYLQLVPVSRSSDLVYEITFATGLMKELAKRCGCPIVLGVQARQEVDTYQQKIPGTNDGQWASRIYQECDKWFSLWRPWITDRDKESIKLGDQVLPITENLLIIRKLKERFFEPRKTWAMYFEPQWLKLTQLETDIKEPNYY